MCGGSLAASRVECSYGRVGQRESDSESTMPPSVLNVEQNALYKQSVWCLERQLGLSELPRWSFFVSPQTQGCFTKPQKSHPAEG